MPPAIFRLVPALIALMAAAMALFPKRLSDGRCTVPPALRQSNRAGRDS